MIICPACKEEIEDDSHYCDQCGQQLLFCKQCGHVGLGRRCTRCGGMMALPAGSMAAANAGANPMATPMGNPMANPMGRPTANPGVGAAVRPGVNISVTPSASVSRAANVPPAQQQQQPVSPRTSNAQNIAASISVGPAISIAQAGAGRSSMPMMTLVNESLNIRITAMNGAIIGRRKGPYIQFFEQNSYVSGIHAQLKYKSGAGWFVIDMNSSNGTRINQNPIQPETENPLKNGDVLSIANVNLQVVIR
ncbi:Forkhead associated (FHA) domain, binds pSer, pThr, pTyr [Xylanibacter ruminicola]|uniref:Forkhead associated (FHA) domain, binds pSer, pThr, pTyr n=1 Tax=Xylanibacter ruminicola TaxID=839 RepID=A0A1H4D5G5_XYLRU|nr:FHA domain-containing protein [Xylanibacter ruminicola]SEA67841.1 Forkhead associated (FHA) domain, binds pSer, pThr, pTyr [Xylanibacter ruminicola]